MILVLVTTKSDAELMQVASKVTPVLAQVGQDFDGVCFVKTDSFPVIVGNGHMVQTATTHIFIMGLVDMDHQGNANNLANQISEASGFKTSIL